jgi:hypothetical protein
LCAYDWIMNITQKERKMVSFAPLFEAFSGMIRQNLPGGKGLVKEMVHYDNALYNQGFSEDNVFPEAMRRDGRATERPGFGNRASWFGNAAGDHAYASTYSPLASLAARPAFSAAWSGSIFLAISSWASLAAFKVMIPAPTIPV